jgi:hypothetical protein
MDSLRYMRCGAACFAVQHAGMILRRGRCRAHRSTCEPPSICSTAGRNAPLDYHALPVGRFLGSASLMAERALAPSNVCALSDREHFPLPVIPTSDPAARAHSFAWNPRAPKRIC